MSKLWAQVISINTFMNINQLESFNLGDAIKFHDELNPKLFVNNKPRPEVKKQLLIIAKDFITELGIKDLAVEDITISGSNAAYTYTDHSDLDLHILVDFNKLSNDEVYQELFNAKKTIYNDSHDIKVHGVPVELYVQNSNEPVVSLGEYSLLKNKWLRIPVKRRANLNQTITKQKYNKLYELVQIALKTKNIDKIEKLLKTMRRYRQAGLDRGGEFSPENLAYKALRSQGWLTKLYKLKDKLHSQNLSIESAYESKGLDNPTPTIDQLVKKHKVSREHILDQLLKGIQVELEHTSDESKATEIALDHLGEDPDYYTKLAKVGLEEARTLDYEYGDCPIFAIALHRLSKLPLMALIEWDDELESTVLIHAYVKLDDKWRIDITGETTVDWMLDKYPNNGDAEETEISEKDLLELGYGKSKCPTLQQVLPAAKEILQDIEGINLVESASGYIPSNAEKNDPRFKTALTVDIKPDTMRKDAKKFGNKISRAGIPPTLRPNGKF